MMIRSFLLLILIIGLTSSDSSVLFSQHVRADNKFIQYTGRIDFSNPQRPVFSYPGVSIKVRFAGTSITAYLKDMPNGDQSNFFVVILDDKVHSVIRLNKSDSVYKLATNLEVGSHTLELFKRTESLVGKTEFIGFKLDKKGKLLDPPARPQRKMEFIGNSITCGYGNEGKDEFQGFADSTENNYMAFGAITARSLNAEYVAVCYSGKGIYRNYGDSPEPALPALYDKIFPEAGAPKWKFKNYIPDAVVIDLGTNDFYGPGLDSVKFVSEYKKFVQRIRINYPEAKIFCVIGPMMSDHYPVGENSLTKIRAYLSKMVGAINQEGDSNVFFFEMSPQGKVGMGSDYHPNIAQHKQNAKELSEFIKEKMGWD